MATPGQPPADPNVPDIQDSGDAASIVAQTSPDLKSGSHDPGLDDGRFHSAHPLFDDLAPQDSCDPKGTYWADLPFGERQKWVNAQSHAEFKRESAVVWGMFKRDPLSPLTAYCKRYVIGGFGLFTEGYT